MAPLTTALAGGLATGLLLTAVAPAYAGDAPGRDRDLVLSFDRVDGAGRPVLDELGPPGIVGAVSAVGGGEVAAGPDRSSSGHSLRMERFRPGQPAAPAVVVVRPVADVLDRTDPGDDDFAFGADFVLDALTGTSPTDNGDNLVQRGLFAAEAQYKIQLDGGHASCRVAGSSGAVTVRATDPVEPEQWYRVRCRRVGDEVTLRVVTGLDSDREVREYAERGATGSLSYDRADSPFSIGGKVDQHGEVLATDSDQFNGRIDDVVFRHLD
jgi:hypothetical protein